MGTNRDSGEPEEDRRSIGERPGINQNPLAPSFRDGPRSAPASYRSILMGLLPVAVIAIGLLIYNLR